MKKLIVLLGLALAITQVSAQSTNHTFIRGSMAIDYNTMTHRDSSNHPLKGYGDLYTLRLDVSDSTLFEGNITNYPRIEVSGLTSTSVAQFGSLLFSLNCSVFKPGDTNQLKYVGKIFGKVPIDSKGNYLFDKGNLQFAGEQINAAPALTGKFSGQAAGKPPVSTATTQTSQLKKGLEHIQKQVQGKTVSINVTNYDKMDFVKLVLGAGPVGIYQDVTVNGSMIYDYDRTVWYFKDVTIDYIDGNAKVTDRLSGNIRWIEAADRNRTGLGHYEFDIRVNEPLSGEASAFSAASDENSFFEADPSIMGLVGNVEYHDHMTSEGPTHSDITFDLKGNSLNKQRTMVLCKLILFTCIVPLNAE